MSYMMINNKRVEFTDEKNVLAVIRKAGIDIPTFCYHSELSTFGACRMCVVEDDKGKIFTSCTEPPRDGMVIYTNTAKLQHHRKMIIELMLASHCRDCTTCFVSGDCTLQKLALRLGIRNVRFEDTRKEMPIDFSSDNIVLDPNKCILCGDCVRTCDEIQGLGILDFAHRGSNVVVAPAFGKKLSETDCVGCGQCRI
ncbi:MAG: (2Fe-2S)-binding protein, partial [Clostridia bacterium]|nr:(2Fe-2S)-binding protein [Clostridia bacterium]